MAVAREYPTERIRNVVVAGHGGSGKTNLVDALCFVAGTTKRRGSVPDGTALTMYTEEEVAHGISIQTALAFAEWRDTKINLLDTPGYLDFTSEALAATRVADGAVVVLGANAGVEVGTERVWEYCTARGIPGLFFVSMMDKEHADFDRAVSEIRSTLTPKAIPLQLPIGSGESFRGVVDLLTGKAHLTRGNASGEYESGDVPAELLDQYESVRNELMEAIAASDDALLERYLEEGEIDLEAALPVLRSAVIHGELFPVLCGAPDTSIGTRELLDAIVDLLPNPAERPAERARKPGTDDVVELVARDDAPLAIFVFKTASEPHVGELTYFRVISGSIENGQEVWNASTDQREKLAHIALALGKERPEVGRMHAGDLGVVAKLKNTHTNDTLSTEARPLEVTRIEFPEPDIRV
ncbi:MAG TPA: GTP-binding protein, partial [Longimicrobiales bacterium]|nr:GTP-binding protein [Longimicrobiales bacterium]